jgi:hypothetical protein
MKVFFANFPFDLCETEICNLFRLFGEIFDRNLVTDPETGKSRGFADAMPHVSERQKTACPNAHLRPQVQRSS